MPAQLVNIDFGGLLILLIKMSAILVLLWLTLILLRKIWRYFQRPEVPPDSVFPDSQFADIDDFNIRYIQRGRKGAPDLVLIHGICASIYSWRLIIDALAKHYHVTAFDLPGFGLSDKHPGQNYGLDAQTDRVLKFLDHLNIKRFYLVGHSMGGGIAAWITKSNPGIVRKLALIAPAIHHKFVRFKPGAWLWGVHLIKKVIVTPTLVRRIYQRICAGYTPENLTEVAQNYYRPFHNNPDAVVTFFKSLELLRDPRLSNDVSGLTCPVLILYAEHDPLIRTKLIQGYLKINAAVSSSLFLQCGHMLPEEKPQLTIDSLHNFFEDRKNN